MINLDDSIRKTRDEGITSISTYTHAKKLAIPLFTNFPLVH